VKKQKEIHHLLSPLPSGERAGERGKSRLDSAENQSPNRVTRRSSSQNAANTTENLQQSTKPDFNYYNTFNFDIGTNMTYIST